MLIIYRQFDATSVKLLLQGSNDGTNYFDFGSVNASTTHTETGINELSWSEPTQYIRLNTTTTVAGDGPNTVSSIYLVTTAGGGAGGGSSSGGGGGGSTSPGGANTQIQFNDSDTFATLVMPLLLLINGSTGYEETTICYSR